MHHCLKNELKNQPVFEPARNVVSNPSVASNAGPGTAPLKDRFTRELAVLANEAYENTLLILTEYHLRVHGRQRPTDLPQQLARMFMAAMSMLIRPLGELLTQLPASGGSDLKAGPCFELSQSVDRRPNLDSIAARWCAMAEQGGKLASDDDAPARLKAVARNLSRLAYNLSRAVKATP
jgi:hypothetical protein